MAEKKVPIISEETKDKMTELKNSVIPSIGKEKDETTTTVTPAVAALGQIYVYMMSKRKLELQIREYDEKLRKKRDRGDDKLYDALIEVEEEKEKKEEEADKKQKKKEKTRKKKKKGGLFDTIAGTVKFAAGAGAVAASVSETQKKEEVQKQAEVGPEAAPEQPAPAPQEAPKQVQERPEPVPQQVVPEPGKPAAPPTQKKVEPVKPAQPPATAQKVDEGMKGKAGKFSTALKSLGITNPYAIQAIIATAAKESGLNPESKEAGAGAWLKTLKSKGIDYVYKVFPQLGPGGNVAKKMGFNTGIPAQVLQDEWSKGDPAFFSMVYDGLSTNSQPGDGFKYKGRGFIQITGRKVYKSIGDIIGVNLESNPESIVADFGTASKAAGAYLMNSIGQGNAKKGLDALNNIKDFQSGLKMVVGNVAHGNLGSDMTKINNVMDNGKLAATDQLQLQKASAYASLGASATGTQLASASETNRDTKADMKQQTAQASTSNTTVVNQKQQQTQTAAVDDRPIWQKKAQG
jgi:cytoskeletal protein RodZ